jgi:hypothetical protein
LSESLPIISRDAFSFSGSDRDKGTGIHRIPDQFMDLLRIVSLIHDIEVGFSGSMALLQEFFGVRDVMHWVL